jgi:Tol biopolymer transport system component/polyisoprenoid-binding protein YceI
MVKRWKGLRLATRLAILIPVALLLLTAAAYGYFAFRTTGAPAPAGLGEAPESRGGPSDLNGDWVLPRENAGFAGYRVREKLGFVPAPNDAVGRTTAVRGSMTIADGRIETAQVTADLRQLDSDEEGRDPAAQEALLTAEFPNGTFRLTEPVDLQSPQIGEVITFQAQSAVTLRGISKNVRFPLEARWNGDTFQVAGQLEIRRSDFELEFPQQVGLRVSDNAKIEVELTFVHESAGTQAPPQTTTGQSEGEEASPRLEPKATGPGRLLVSMMERRDGTIAIYSVNVDGSNLVRLVKPLREPGAWSSDLGPELSPDGSKLAYTRGIATETSGEPDQIYVLDPSRSRRPKQLADESFTATLWPTWSPDGSKLAFTRSEGDSSGIWLMGANGKNPRALTEDDLVEEETFTPDEFPTWSPDGTKIAFNSFLPEGNDDIFVMNADGSGQTRLTSGLEYDSDPAWSPDGERIAFSRDGDIYLMNPDGTSIRQLTRGSARDGAPAWSRDGRWLAFARADERGTTFAGPSRIIVMRANGSRLGRVPLPREAFWPSWAS